MWRVTDARQQLSCFSNLDLARMLYCKNLSVMFLEKLKLIGFTFLMTGNLKGPGFSNIKTSIVRLRLNTLC